MANQQKTSYVSDLLEKLQANPHIILVSFTTTSHKALEGFRSKLHAQEDKIELVVLKNSLFKIAFDKLNKKENLLSEEDSLRLQGFTKGQIALMLVQKDWSSALKVLKDFAKEDETISFQAGVIDGTVYEADGLKELANLPSKEQLIAKLIGTLKAPHSRFVYSLQFNTTKLVNVIKNAADAAKN